MSCQKYFLLIRVGCYLAAGLVKKKFQNSFGVRKRERKEINMGFLTRLFGGYKRNGTEMVERYEAETLPTPAGVNIPENFGYIHFKAYKYLKLGPDAYSAQDALGMPPNGAPPPLLALVEQGCRQIVNWKGLSPERPLQGLGIKGFYRMIEVFHFKVSEQSATFGNDGNVMDKMTIKHSVTGEQIALYNLVKK
jgi:hypothetical protein